MSFQEHRPLCSFIWARFVSNERELRIGWCQIRHRRQLRLLSKKIQTKKNITFNFQNFILKNIISIFDFGTYNSFYYKKSIFRQPPFKNSLNKKLYLHYGYLLIITGIWRLYCVIRQCRAQIPANCCVRQ